jgi:hypothetical protein
VRARARAPARPRRFAASRRGVPIRLVGRGGNIGRAASSGKNKALGKL